MIVGILGGGQLARMLALAGYPLGFRFVFLDPAEDAAAGPVAEQIRGAFDDTKALGSLAARVDVVTYEFENVPATSVRWLAERVPVHPSAEALSAAQDRLEEKRLFRSLAIPTTEFEAVDSEAALQAAVRNRGGRVVAKTRTHGYDGKGQVVLDDAKQASSAWKALGRPSIVEEHVEFDRELSVIGVRSRDGQTRFYPISENVHSGGILRTSISRPGDAMEAIAHDYARRILDRLEYVGVLAVELFQKGEALVANEFAPRVHNSGHWTIEGAGTSQFENHLRAVAGLPLGSTAPSGLAAMVNCIGMLPDAAEVLAIEGAHLHAYGKTPRTGRKVGHVTVRTKTAAALPPLLARLEEMIAQS